MVSCCVRACKVTKLNNPNKYTFHRFPTNPVLKEKWLTILNRKGWSPKRNSTVCSKHFESKYIIIQRKGRQCLISNVIPTLFVPVTLKQPPLCLCSFTLSPIKTSEIISQGIQGPIVKQEPGVQQEPRVKQEPGVQQEPGVKQEPGVQQEPGVKQEPGVQQENDITENDNKIMNLQDKGASDNAGHIPTDEIKYEVTSDDDNDNTQMSDNVEGHNSQVLSNSDCTSINIYDDLIDIENDTKTSDFKFDIPEILDDVGDEIAPGTSNFGKKQAMSVEDINLQRLKSGEVDKLSEDTESGPILKKREHRRTNTDPATAQNFSCHRCGYNTTTKHHFGENYFSCDKCDFKCRNKKRLKSHLFTHTGEYPFSCDKCEYKCISKGYLKRHLSKHAEKQFLCYKCNYNCRSESILKNHLLTHTAKKTFLCDKCDYKCISKTYLKKHLLIHAEKTFSCDKCDYKCINKTYLKKHLLIHAEKTFSCDKCDYKCINKKYLKQHLLIHAEKTFSCDKCEYKCINNKTYIKQHLSKHIEKSFSCDKCDYKCRRKWSLKSHVLLRHTRGEKAFSRDKCNYKCSLTHTAEKNDSNSTNRCHKCDYKCINECNLQPHLLPHMTEENVTLLRNAKQKLKDYYKYIWFYNGNVLARKTVGDFVVVIKSDEDIVRLIQKLCFGIT